MMRRMTWAGMALAVAVAIPVGMAWANHVRIEVSGEAQPGVIYAPSGTTVVVPGQAPAAFPPTLQADEIRAHQVRASTIYANKISADEVRGVVYQTRGVKIHDTRGDIRAPEVTASVIYADEIKANSVVADAIYVRDLHRR
ncbi:MAG TPA: hypothetical protein VFO18_01755 [Methylomirabilota bacterium]|nr:hypothetical protein [Methylomirabilota bacterium]